MSLGAPDLGPFALGPKIGGGGMATVYLGKYVPAPGEEAPPEQEVVALKVIKGDFVANDEYEKMFLDEAQILTRLSHPNVIRTVGYGAQAGAWFIAMELLMGRSLLDLWEAASEEKRTIPIDVAAHVARELARGLDHAHNLVDEDDGRKLGLVHRDVNPSNVFVGYDGTVKLIDFGLAKARKRQTQSARGLIKGKIPYLSPEQIREDALDGRSDVYALGTTLWELVTMRRLFKRDSDIGTVRAIQKGDVPDPRESIPGFPEALWKIIERSLRRDREERYPTAGAMADDLDRFLGDAKRAALQAKLAALVEQLFPGEADEQADWLSEATGKERKKLAPPVPIAEVPELEPSVPVMPTAAPSAKAASEPEPAAKAKPAAETKAAKVAEPEAAKVAEPERALEAPEASLAEPEPVPPKRHGPSVIVYALLGALAGAVALVAWIALR